MLLSLLKRVHVIYQQGGETSTDKRYVFHKAQTPSTRGGAHSQGMRWSRNIY